MSSKFRTSFCLSAFIFVIVIFGSLFLAPESYARMEYDNAWNHTEGDPGDGDDSMGSGSGSLDGSSSDVFSRNEDFRPYVLADFWVLFQINDSWVVVIPADPRFESIDMYIQSSIPLGGLTK